MAPWLAISLKSFGRNQYQLDALEDIVPPSLVFHGPVDILSAVSTQLQEII